MSSFKERWEIEVGNAATVTELVEYLGSPAGAVRTATRRWRERRGGESVLILRRPGCRPYRLFKTED